MRRVRGEVATYLLLLGLLFRLEEDISGRVEVDTRVERPVAQADSPAFSRN